MILSAFGNCMRYSTVLHSFANKYCPVEAYTPIDLNASSVNRREVD